MPKLLSASKAGRVEVIRFEFKELSLKQREILKKELNGALKLGGKNFILDLSRVGFLSSLTIATIVYFAKDARLRGGDVRLVNLSEDARNIFYITKLDKIFKFYDTVEEAAASFN